jgi:hypothetical protein
MSSLRKRGNDEQSVALIYTALVGLGSTAFGIIIGTISGIAGVKFFTAQ